jgi:hypothetical protein
MVRAPATARDEACGLLAGRGTMAHEVVGIGVLPHNMWSEPGGP